MGKSRKSHLSTHVALISFRAIHVSEELHWTIKLPRKFLRFTAKAGQSHRECSAVLQFGVSLKPN